MPAGRGWAGTPTRKGLPKRASTINNLLVAVKDFYRVLVELDVVPVDPARKLVLVKMPQRLPPPVLKTEEVARLLDSIEPGTRHGGRDRAMYELMSSCAKNGSAQVVVISSASRRFEGMLNPVLCQKCIGGKEREIGRFPSASTG